MQESEELTLSLITFYPSKPVWRYTNYFSNVFNWKN